MKKRNFLKVLTMSILMFSLTLSICSAETQTVSMEGVIKTASYGNGYRFDRNGCKISQVFFFLAEEK